MEHREARSKTAFLAQRAACPVWTASRPWRATTSTAHRIAHGSPHGESGVASARSGEAANTRGPSDAAQAVTEYTNPQHMVTEGTATEQAAN